MDRRQAQDLDNWITGHYGEDQFRDDCPDNETTKQWTEESLAQAIAEEGLAFVVRNLNTTTQLLEALRPLATLGLWEDNYPPDSAEYAEAKAEDSRLEVRVRPSQVRAARAAIAAADGK